ncbi:MAG: pitrilysin family protein [Clostridia bacterium]
MFKNEVYVNKMLEDTIYMQELECGLKVYVCPKKNFNKYLGMFGTVFGSIDNYIINQDNEEIKLPDGVAHFLEHKLFEQEGENALDLFAKEGVNANAYTSYDHTVYSFETVEDVNKSIEMLIKMVRTPYFTDDNVEKEKGIIAQEINMYKDDPNWQVYLNVIKALYSKHPINIDIAGSVASIKKINKEILYAAYNNYYSLNNMFFIVVGDVEKDNIFKLVDNEVRKYNYKESIKQAKKIKNINEPLKINKNEIIETADIYIPKLYIGYKLNPLQGDENIKRNIAILLIEDLYFSKLSEFYNENYNKGYINEAIDVRNEFGSTYSFLTLGISCFNPNQIKEKLLKYIEEIKTKEIIQSDFEVFKRKHIGSLIYSYEDLEEYCEEIIGSIIMQTKPFKVFDIINEIDSKYIKETLNVLFNPENLSISIVNSINA